MISLQLFINCSFPSWTNVVLYEKEAEIQINYAFRQNQQRSLTNRDLDLGPRPTSLCSVVFWLRTAGTLHLGLVKCFRSCLN